MKRALVSVLVLGAISVMPARHAGADYCAPYVYIDCKANHHLYVRSRWVCDSETPSTKYGRAFDTEALKNNLHECQITPSIEASIYLYPSSLAVILNNNAKRGFGYSFGDPDEIEDIYVSGSGDHAEMVSEYRRERGAKKVKRVIHFTAKKRKPVYLGN